MATGAVETALGRGGEQLAAPGDELVILVLHGTGLTARLEDPVERQDDDQHGEEQHAEQLHPLEALAFEYLIVVVGLAVGRQLDLGTDFSLSRTTVREVVGHPAEDGDRQDHPADGVTR